MKAVIIVVFFVALAATMISPAYAVPPPPLWSDPVLTNSIALSGDGQYVIVGTPSEVRFYGRSSSTPLWTSSPGGAFYSVAISEDGSYAVGSSLGVVYFWANAKSLTGNPAATWSSFYLGGIIQRRCLAISDDGNYVAACGTGPNVFYWADAAANSGPNIAYTWSYLLGGQVEAITMSDDGNHVAAVGTLSNFGTEGVLAYWNNAKSLTGPQSPTWSAQEAGEQFVDVAISDDGNYVVVAGAAETPSTVYYWADATSRTGTSEPHTWSGGVDVVFQAVDISCDGDSVVAGALVANGKGAVYFWGGARSLTGTPSPTWTYSTDSAVWDVAINDAGTYMAAVDTPPATDTLHFFDKQGNVLWEDTSIAGDKLSISCDGKTLAVGTPVIDTAYLFDTGYSSLCCGQVPPPIPEYPLGLALLATFMVIAYGIIRRRTPPKKE
jgi:hypothetical protein